MASQTHATPERILEVAARLFGTQRFHEVRMEDVAAQAGFGKGTLYRYFRDKDELYLALLERAGVQLAERIHQQVAEATHPEAQLRAVAAASLEFFDQQPHVFDLIQRADAQRGLHSPWQRFRDEVFELVQRILARGQAEGDFCIADLTTTSLIFLGGLRAVIRFGPRPHAPDLPQRIVETVLFGAGLCRPSTFPSSD